MYRSNDKKNCSGGSKTVPKTPKRETAFSKIKDTINMFDNLALTHQQQRFAHSTKIVIP